jgi:hypothetical protein
MDFLSLALYSEGSTDDRFLSLVIERTARLILQVYQQNNWQILPVKPIERPKQGSRPERILKAACIASEYQALIIHSDEDGNGLAATHKHRFQPGYDLVQHEVTLQRGSVCERLIPLFPIQEVEAWMLADYELLLEEIGTKKRAEDLNIPKKARLAESIAHPKERLKEAIKLAFKDHPSRLRRTSVEEIKGSLYEPMGRNVSLDRLEQLDGYKYFKAELIDAFKAMSIIY